MKLETRRRISHLHSVSDSGGRRNTIFTHLSWYGNEKCIAKVERFQFFVKFYREKAKREMVVIFEYFFHRLGRKTKIHHRIDKAIGRPEKCEI